MKGRSCTTRGFSLFETLVAIFILLVSVTGAMTLTQKSLSSSYYSRDQVIAAFLAQDAIEYIRSVRDYNTLRSLDGESPSPKFTAGLTECVAGSLTCKVETTKGNLNGVQPCQGSNEDCKKLYFNSSGEYTHDPTSATVSRFSRSVTMGYVGQGQKELSVVVTVEWRTGSFGVQSFRVRENLTSWGEAE